MGFYIPMDEVRTANLNRISIFMRQPLLFEEIDWFFIKEVTNIPIENFQKVLKNKVCSMSQREMQKCSQTLILILFEFSGVFSSIKA